MLTPADIRLQGFLGASGRARNRKISGTPARGSRASTGWTGAEPFRSVPCFFAFSPAGAPSPACPAFPGRRTGPHPGEIAVRFYLPPR